MDVDKIIDDVVQCRSGGKVERCHGIPHIGSYSNAAHQWGVAMLMWHLWPADFERLAIYCLTHDVPESWVGDVPSPTMTFVEGLRERLGKIEDDINAGIGLPRYGELSGLDREKVRACDILELYLWCREQQLLGNQFVNECLAEIAHFRTRWPLPEPAQAFYERTLGSTLLPRQAGVVRSHTTATKE